MRMLKYDGLCARGIIRGFEEAWLEEVMGWLGEEGVGRRGGMGERAVSGRFDFASLYL